MLQRVLDHSGVPPTLPGTAATDLLPEAAQEVAEVVSEVGLQVALGIVEALAAPLAPEAPVGLSAAADGRAAIVLSWTAPAQADTRAPVTGYAIEVSPNGTDAWTPLASVGRTTTWRHIGLSDGATRYYRVRATSLRSHSPFSNLARAAIPPAPPPAVTLTPEPRSIQQGQSLTLRWTSRDATEIDLQPGIGTVPAQGSRSVSPTASTTYTITARGAGGSAEATVRVTVTPPPPPPGEPEAAVTRTGTDGNDVLKGGDGDDLLMGKKGRDVLRGKGGRDDLRGGSGHDELYGGKGDDELVGGKGDDTFRGGPGADRFVFAPRDTGDKIINDFDAAEGDRIVLLTNRQPSVADIIANAVAEGDRFMVYTLFAGLTVETGVPLRSEDFVVKAP